MQRSWFYVIAPTLAINLVGCYGPEPFEPGRMGRDLDRPPRYGETNRFVEPMGGPPPPDMAPPNPGGPGLSGSASVNVDPGLSVAPPAPSNPPPTPPDSTAGTSSSSSTNPSAAGSASASGNVPYARAVPGKPGFVYSPHEAGKILDVTGLRPGTKVKDPQTGAMFRVP